MQFLFYLLIRLDLLFCHCDGEKIKEVVSLLMRYEN